MENEAIEILAKEVRDVWWGSPQIDWHLISEKGRHNWIAVVCKVLEKVQDQKPIAEVSSSEIRSAWGKLYCNRIGLSDSECLNLFNHVIANRNSPPKPVDPRVDALRRGYEKYRVDGERSERADAIFLAQLEELDKLK